MPASPQSSQIVFIHGMWSTPSVCTGLREVVEKQGFGFHAPTLPEHTASFSGEKLAQLSIADYADFVRSYIRKQGLDDAPLILIGHSMGGLIAQIIAQDIEVESLVLINSVAPTQIKHTFPKPLLTAYHLLRQPSFWQGINRPSWKSASFGLFNCMDEATAKATHENLVYESGQVFREIVFPKFYPQPAAQVEASQVTGRKLIISGRNDRIVGPHLAMALAAFYPEAELRMFPRNGHWIFGEDGDQLILQGLVDWLKPTRRRHHQAPSIPQRETTPAVRI